MQPRILSLFDSLPRLLRQSMGMILPVAALMLLTAAHAHAATDPTSSPLELDTMLANFIININGPILQITYVGCYTFGVYLLVKGLFKCIKYSDEGSKGQQKFSGIWGTLLVAALLISTPSMLATTANTMGLMNSGGKQAALSYNACSADPSDPNCAQVQQKIQTTYWTIITFVQMLGLISFVRGLSILRSVTDGNTQVTSMAGLTHVFAGAIAWNLGDFVQMIGNTVQYSI